MDEYIDTAIWCINSKNADLERLGLDTEDDRDEWVDAVISLRNISAVKLCPGGFAEGKADILINGDWSVINYDYREFVALFKKYIDGRKG